MCVQVAVLLFCWGVFVMFTLLLSHYHRCSVQYWVIFGVQAVACIAAEALFIYLVSSTQETGSCAFHCSTIHSFSDLTFIAYQT